MNIFNKKLLMAFAFVLTLTSFNAQAVDWKDKWENFTENVSSGYKKTKNFVFNKEVYAKAYNSAKSNSQDFFSEVKKGDVRACSILAGTAAAAVIIVALIARRNTVSNHNNPEQV